MSDCIFSKVATFYDEADEDELNWISPRGSFAVVEMDGREFFVSDELSALSAFGKYSSNVYKRVRMEDASIAVLDIAVIKSSSEESTRFIERLIDVEDNSQVIIDTCKLLNIDVPSLPETGVITRNRYMLYLKELEGSLVYVKESDAIMILDKSYITSEPFIGELIEIHCCLFGLYNEKAARLKRTTQAIGSAFDVEKLPVVKATDDNIERITTRNKDSVSMLLKRKMSYVEFTGTAVKPGRFAPERVELNAARMMVDAECLMQVSRGHLEHMYKSIGLRYSAHSGLEQSLESYDNINFATMSDWAVAYDITRNEWFMVKANLCKEVDFNKNLFDQLVLPNERKTIVKSLVQYGPGSGADIVAGKGGGTIILLDGHPGTGKTLTAEASAEILHRPLYKVGLGQLGIDVDYLEERLGEVLFMANRWEAVLLIDEADVFMEKRTTENLHRNAIVATFLRLLEYYNGIMFLTTNRGADFDEAFYSRITLALRYNALSFDSIQQIWKMLIDSNGIELENPNQFHQIVETSEKHLPGLNGRTIKNLIAIAKSIAAWQGLPVNHRHLLSAIEIQGEFHDNC